MINFKKVKSMSIDEMFEKSMSIDDMVEKILCSKDCCYHCIYNKPDGACYRNANAECMYGIRTWLEREVENREG